MTEQILAVQKMQDYIEEHLTEEITLAALANICNFSPWYAHRLFREYTGFAPAEYIRRMRLAKSAQRLKTEHTRIISRSTFLIRSATNAATSASITLRSALSAIAKILII